MLKLIQNGVRHFKRISLSKCETYKDHLYYQNHLVILNHNELKLKLLKHIYNLLIASYLSQKKNFRTALIKILLTKYA